MENKQNIFVKLKEGIDTGVSYLLSHIKKEHALMLLSVFLAKNLDAQGFSSLAEKEMHINHDDEIAPDSLSHRSVQFYDVQGNTLSKHAIDWLAVSNDLMYKKLNTLNFLEAQELFYLYFGPGLASQEYIRKANGHPDLLIRILILSTVEKWGNFASFNHGVVWDETMGKYKKTSSITNRGTFQIHAGSYSAMRKKYAGYLQKSLHSLGVKEISGMATMDRSIKTTKDIEIFENHVKEFLGKDLLNQQQRSLADAQMDLAVHLKYLNARAARFYKAKGRDFRDEFANPNLSKTWLAQFMSYWVQGGKAIIGKTFLKRESYEVRKLLSHPVVKTSGSNFLQVLVDQELKMEGLSRETELISLLDVNYGKEIVVEDEVVEEENLAEILVEDALEIIKKDSLDVPFEQTLKTDFVMNKFLDMKESIANGDDDVYFLLEVQKGGLDGGPIPTFYNFAVTMVNMGLIKTSDINQLLASIKLSCRGSDFKFSEYQFLRAGQKVPVKLVDLEKFLVDDWMSLLNISSD